MTYCRSAYMARNRIKTDLWMRCWKWSIKIRTVWGSFSFQNWHSCCCWAFSCPWHSSLQIYLRGLQTSRSVQSRCCTTLKQVPRGDGKWSEAREEKHDQNKQNKGVNYGPGQFWTVSFMAVHVVRLLYRRCFFVYNMKTWNYRQTVLWAEKNFWEQLTLVQSKSRCFKVRLHMKW